MVPESLCGFCQELPVLKRKKAAGRESRCPLCKSKLICADGGTTYRLVEEEEQPSGTFVKHWWQKLGVG